jgi:hypothetical protein
VVEPKFKNTVAGNGNKQNGKQNKEEDIRKEKINSLKGQYSTVISIKFRMTRFGDFLYSRFIHSTPHMLMSPKNLEI